jgi:pimeloyl-ACP methyl ester carboxylesterase
MSGNQSSAITEDSTSRSITVDGVPIHYNEAGTGPALVLIHGGGPGATGWSNYSRNIGPLSEHFRVLTPDLPGFGRSGVKPPGSPMPGWYATKMGQFLDALGVEKAHFVGNSLGGMVTLRLAMDRPEKIHRMILMGPGGSIPMFSQFPTEAIMTLLTFYEGEGPSMARLKQFVKHFVYDPSQLTEELLEERMRVALSPHIVETPPMRPDPNAPLEPIWSDPRLATLPHETMIIWGREDKVLPLDMAMPLVKQIPRARLFVMPQCGHWCQWEHADEFNRTTMGFFQAAGDS